MDTTPIMVVMAWLATGGADLLRQERALMRLAAIYGMIVGIREVAQMLGHGGDPTGGYYGPGFFVNAYPKHMSAARRRVG